MAIDPRIRARRVEVRRAEGRRRLRFLMVAVGIVGLAVGAWGLTRTPLLDLDHIRLEGVAPADVDTVTEVAALETGTPMFDLDLGTVEADLTSLPWVRSATAHREWPGTVRIDVDVREPVAVVGRTGGDAYLADAEGVLLRPAPDESALPRVAIEPAVALGEIDEAARPGIAVAMAIPDDLRRWVEAVTTQASTDDATAEVGLDLIGSAVVRLGGIDHIGDKLDALRSLLEGADLTCVTEIDVVVADLATMTRDAECEGGTADGGGSGDA